MRSDSQFVESTTRFFGLIGRSIHGHAENVVESDSAFALSILFTPFTGAAKGVFDFFTRRSIPSIEIESLKSAVNGADEHTLKKLCELIIAAEFKSDSSKKLQGILNEWDVWETMPAKFNKLLEDEKQAHLQRARNDIQKNVSPLYQKFCGLSPEKIGEITDKVESDKEILRARFLKNLHIARKKLITDYLSLDHNVGKKAMQIIQDYFSPPKTQSSQTLEAGSVDMQPIVNRGAQ